MTRILLFGTGSIGSIYAYILTQGGSSVTCVCRSNYHAVKTHGFRINSGVFGQDLHLQPDVVRSVDEAAAQQQQWDYIIVASKAFPGAQPSTASAIAPAVGPKTAIVLVQNGVGIEEEYKVAFPSNPVISAVVYLPVTQTAPGVVEMGALELLEVGTYPSEALTSGSAAVLPLKEFVELVKRGNGTIVAYDDVQVRRWNKMLVNAAWNPTCALARQSDVEFMASSPYATDFVWNVMLEVVAIAQALGYAEITEKEAERQLGRAKARIGTKGIEPSMLADVKGDRSMEVEAIVGNVVRIAKEKGVSTPYLLALYALSKGLDEGMRQRRTAI